ncbi:hypothetical protein DD592_26645 [Enterobacter cloacae complex sp. 2DZ2F20B]|nr:hypothetical protein DD592_26645 [Enterobacter cloacae complex sp. 2DZ2F20B]
MFIGFDKLNLTFWISLFEKLLLLCKTDQMIYSVQLQSTFQGVIHDKALKRFSDNLQFLKLKCIAVAFTNDR